MKINIILCILVLGLSKEIATPSQNKEKSELIEEKKGEAESELNSEKTMRSVNNWEFLETSESSSQKIRPPRPKKNYLETSESSSEEAEAFLSASTY